MRKLLFLLVLIPFFTYSQNVGLLPNSITPIDTASYTLVAQPSATTLRKLSLNRIYNAMPFASGSVNGRLSSTDWNTFNNKLGSSRTLTINGTTFDLSANRTWSVGDVLTTGTYANPSWITSLGWSKITGAPSFLTSETDPLYTANGVANTRALTINGMAGRITSSAGSQTLAADRTWTLDLATVGTAGTYRSVTTDVYGRVTNGTNPSTLGGYGITDAWSVNSGATFTAPNIISGSSTNTLLARFNSLGTTVTDGAGLWLQNQTAAASGLQQISPIFTFEGQGWRTSATAQSRPIRYNNYLLPVQGTADPSGNLIWEYSVNNSAYSTVLRYDGANRRFEAPNGTIIAGANTTTQFASIGSTATGGQVIIASPIAGQMSTNITSGRFFWDLTSNTNAIVFRNNTSSDVLGVAEFQTFLNTLNPTTSVKRSVVSVPVSFAHTSTAADVSAFLYNGTWAPDRAGTYTLKGLDISPTINVGANSNSGLSLIGLDYNPNVINIGAATHLAQRIVTGNIVWGATTPTSNTRFDLLGIGSGSDIIQRWADNLNNQRFAFQSDGVFVANGTTGTANQVLTTNSSGVPTWQNATSGFADPMTTSGDIIIRNGSNVTTRLGIGSANQVLTVSGGVPAWVTPSGGGITDGDKGDITVSGSGNTWTIDNQAVTFAKIQNVTDQRLLGRSAGSNGSVQEITTQSPIELVNGVLQYNVRRSNALTIESDFYNTTAPYAQGLTGTAISGGTVNIISGEPNHPGVIDIRDGTTANGGWNVTTAINAIRIAGGERSVITFQIRNARATANGWMGFRDNSTNAQPVDGVYAYFVGNGTNVTMSARTRSNSTETVNATTWQPALNTWYTLVIELNSGATSANFEVFDDSGVSQWSVSNTANIPTAVGRETGWGIQANESTTDAAAAIMYIDYARMEINRTLTR
jgi:hypothetical protein